MLIKVTGILASLETEHGRSKERRIVCQSKMERVLLSFVNHLEVIKVFCSRNILLEGLLNQ